MQNVTAAQHQESKEVPGVTESACAQLAQCVAQPEASKSGRGRRFDANNTGTSGSKRKRVSFEDKLESTACPDKHNASCGTNPKVNKRSKMVFDIHRTLEDTNQALNTAKLKPLLSTPSALFETLCANFEAEYPGLLPQTETERIMQQLTQPKIS